MPHLTLDRLLKNHAGIVPSPESPFDSQWLPHPRRHLSIWSQSGPANTANTILVKYANISRELTETVPSRCAWHENSHSPPSVDNLVNKSRSSAKEGTNGVRIHHIAYFLGIRLLLAEPPVIVVRA